MGNTWTTQIVLCYEREPYLVFDGTQAVLEQAIAIENPPTNSDDVVREWLIANMNHLREEVALIRDHSDEVMVPGRRDRLACKAILLIQYFLVRRQRNLSTGGAVLLNLTHKSSEDGMPTIQIAGLAQPLTIAQIRAMSTAKHLYPPENEPTPKIKPKPSEKRVCVSMMAFWRSDHPDGITVEVIPVGNADLEAEMEALDLLLLKLEEARPTAEIWQKWFAQLLRNPKDSDMNLQIMAAIAYGEEAGYFPSDEYNGMVYIYRANGKFSIERKGT